MYCLYKMYLFLLFLEKHNALRLFFSPLPSYSPQLFCNIGQFGGKKYLTDHWAANTFQLFVAVEGNFSSIFFFWTSYSECGFARDYEINVTAYLSAYDQNRH